MARRSEENSSNTQGTINVKNPSYINPLLKDADSKASIYIIMKRGIN